MQPHVQAIVASPPGTQGMMFWYYVLASRIDDWPGVVGSDAVDGLIRWRRPTGAASQCVDAKIAAADPDGAAVLLGRVRLVGGHRSGGVDDDGCPRSTAIRSPSVPAIRCSGVGSAPHELPVAFGGAGVERALVQAADSAAGEATVDAACLVNAVRQRAQRLTSPADDAPVLAVGWHPPTSPPISIWRRCMTVAPDRARRR